MAKHSWGRSEKYHRRPRTIYALVFRRHHVYIGQTVEPAKRIKQHHRSGWWTHDFRMVALSCPLVTEEEAKDWEHGYRQAAVWHGWKVYAKQPGYVIPRVADQMTARRYWIALQVWFRFARLMRAD